MTAGQWLGIGMMLLVVAGAAFAFRQGEKVKPSRDDPYRGDSNIGGQWGGDAGGHGGGDAGGH
jgi:hypothetical protein